MKSRVCIIFAVILLCAILLTGCTDNSNARDYELVSIDCLATEAVNKIVFADIEYAYVTLKDKSVVLKLTYNKMVSVDDKEQSERVKIDEVSKCKLNKEKTTYSIKDGLLKGDLTPSNGYVESIIELDGANYLLLFVLKA